MFWLDSSEYFLFNCLAPHLYRIKQFLKFGLCRTQVKGDILVNDAVRDLNKFRKMSCYIMQFDELSPYLSVLEVMELSTELKIGNRMKSDEKKVLVSLIFHLFTL